MKKLLMLSILSFLFAASSAFASCPCQLKKVSCNTCEEVKVTCCKQACPDRTFQGQCCNKKTFLQKLWNGTKVAYDNSLGAIYDTVMVPFR